MFSNDAMCCVFIFGLSEVVPMRRVFQNFKPTQVLFLKKNPPSDTTRRGVFHQHTDTELPTKKVLDRYHHP
jgi:hypothetical protein